MEAVTEPNRRLWDVFVDPPAVSERECLCETNSTMHNLFLVGLFERFADLREQFQPLPIGELMSVAIAVEPPSGS
jgi:hypothetical protein